ncbi:DNA-binding transcriptional LysR family regulator [Kitasatospora sp. MAA4]|uniref:LysR family transcriptional regulator n=1 Tax=Kitasatospora sp. MAA4 TaxID=3035093 RepID=UPI002476866F|nr:LysR family transcriptional regulator [Kitasatospora sp. MAA4]MDH6136239.1 DNA-binding transcriptional LysR family regulator [Kitasatospora sp. MAA4]
MDLDLAQVRAFTSTAEELHFGRAAERLAISQQALSKRIARLEELLGTRLFDRDRHGVRLTAAGRRFLEPARRLLADGDSAVAALREDRRPLRIDFWSHLYVPMRTVAQAVEAAGLTVEPAPGRDLPSVAAALLRGATDAGFGRVHPLGRRGQRGEPGEPGERLDRDDRGERLDAGLTHRLVRLEPVDVLLSTAHPLADATALRPAQLRDSVLCYPAPIDRLDFLNRFADHFGITERAGGRNLGFDHFIQHLRTDPRHFSLFPADSPLPDLPGVRSIPLVDPTPLYAWSLLWRVTDPHPLLEPLLRAFTEQARHSRWLDYDPRHDWLPGPDRAALPG